MKVFDRIGAAFSKDREEEIAQKSATDEERKWLNIILFECCKEIPERIKSSLISKQFGVELYKEQMINEILENKEGLSDEKVKELVKGASELKIPTKEIEERFLSEEQQRILNGYYGLITMRIDTLAKKIDNRNSLEDVKHDEKFIRMMAVNEASLKTVYERLKHKSDSIRAIEARIYSHEDISKVNELMEVRVRILKEYDEAKDRLAEILAKKAVFDAFKEIVLDRKMNAVKKAVI